MAKALAEVKVPGVVIVGGDSADGKGSSLTETLMNLLLLKSTGVLPDEESNPARARLAASQPGG